MTHDPKKLSRSRLITPKPDVPTPRHPAKPICSRYRGDHKPVVERQHRRRCGG